MNPEFSRPERVDSIGSTVRTVDIEAGPAERIALAKRFDLLAVDQLTGTFSVRQESGGITAHGRVDAVVTQACAITGDPVVAHINEAVALRFVAPSNTTEEIELATDSLDTIEFSGGAIDLGEAAAETMALGIDPYPRSPGAAERSKEAGIVAEDEVRPAGAFAGLKAALDRKG